MRNYLGRTISFLLAVLVVVFMLSRVEWSAFGELLGRLSPLSLLSVFSLYVLLNFFRALRYRVLLDRDLPLVDVSLIALFHNFLVRLLPFKLGEVSYIILMKQRLGVSTKEGVSSLFSSRLLELLVIILVAAASLILSTDVLPNQRGLAWLLVLVCFGVGITGFYFMGALLRSSLSLIGYVLPLRFFEKIQPKFTSLALEFDRLRQGRLFLRALFWSCFTYSSSFAVNALLLFAIGIQPEMGTLIVLVSLGMFATAFPFNVSGFGAVELSWAFGLNQLLGYSIGEGTSIGLLLNGYQVLCALVSGGVAYLILQVWKKKVTGTLTGEG